MITYNTWQELILIILYFYDEKICGMVITYGKCGTEDNVIK